MKPNSGNAKNIFYVRFPGVLLLGVGAGFFSGAPCGFLAPGNSPPASELYPWMTIWFRGWPGQESLMAQTPMVTLVRAVQPSSCRRDEMEAGVSY